MQRTEKEIGQVVEAVRDSISLASVDLPDEFYPAHLSVALIDAIWRPRLGEHALGVVEQYCGRFGIASRRAQRWQRPLREEQEPLGTLVAHYETLGLRVMSGEVLCVRGRPSFDGAGEAAALSHAAWALRTLGIEVLQDVAGRAPGVIEYALRTWTRMRESDVRRFLMYTSGEDFVCADLPLRRFVARALGVEAVPAHRARKLVRGAAHQLILSPRFLDCEIWRLSDSGGAPATCHGGE